MSERPCTCHPDDKPPVPCARQYALTECRRAAAMSETERLIDALRDGAVCYGQRKARWDYVQDCRGFLLAHIAAKDARIAELERERGET